MEMVTATNAGADKAQDKSGHGAGAGTAGATEDFAGMSSPAFDRKAATTDIAGSRNQGSDRSSIVQNNPNIFGPDVPPIPSLRGNFEDVVRSLQAHPLFGGVVGPNGTPVLPGDPGFPGTAGAAGSPAGSPAGAAGSPAGAAGAPGSSAGSGGIVSGEPGLSGWQIFFAGVKMAWILVQAPADGFAGRMVGRDYGEFLPMLTFNDEKSVVERMRALMAWDPYAAMEGRGANFNQRIVNKGDPEIIKMQKAARSGDQVLLETLFTNWKLAHPLTP